MDDLALWIQAQRLSPSERAVLLAAARVADGAGLVRMAVGELASLAQVSRSTVFRVLRALELRGLVWRVDRVSSSGARLESDLHIGPAASQLRELHSGKQDRPSVVSGASAPSALGELESGSDERLREIVRWCLASDWSSQARSMLSEELSSQAGRVFYSVAMRRTCLPQDQRLSDTLSIAWQAVVDNANRLVDPATRSPWGLLANIVRCATWEADYQGPSAPLPVALDENLSADLVRLSDACGMDVAHWDEVETAFAGIIDALSGVGVARATVRAVVARLAMLLMTAPRSKQHTAAAQDNELALWVPSAAARRLLVTMVIGTRRQPRLLADAPAGELETLAARVVSLCPEMATPKTM